MIIDLLGNYIAVIADVLPQENTTPLSDSAAAIPYHTILGRASDFAIAQNRVDPAQNAQLQYLIFVGKRMWGVGRACQNQANLMIWAWGLRCITILTTVIHQ